MFIELIATVFAGIACAGVAMLLNIITRKRLPKWVMPAAAGLGMIAMTISNEYTWFDRTVEKLPDGVEVALSVEEKGWFRPWTQIWPYKKRFAAVDVGTSRKNENFPSQRMADLYFFGRWSPVNQVQMVFDCAEKRSALLADGVSFSKDGAVLNADWQKVGEGDPFLKRICGA